jgi:hypothetical protein
MPRWTKGQSGNPSGHKNTPGQIREYARQYTKDAVDALVKACKRPGERVGAATVLLAYGYGKPQNSLNLRVIRDITELSEDELIAIAGTDDDILLIEGETGDTTE